ncbi:MAG: hypothetical protein EOP82_06335 [Variovorax sp.]|nr:MAG: hypothetical protein EOP82_06335 [Variovorax sp.]
MPALRDMALTVEERSKGEFYWVLIEAFSGDGSEAMYYRRFQSASVPQPTYSNALTLGAALLRKLAESEPAPPDGGA